MKREELEQALHARIEQLWERIESQHAELVNLEELVRQLRGAIMRWELRAKTYEQRYKRCQAYTRLSKLIAAAMKETEQA